MDISAVYERLADIALSEFADVVLQAQVLCLSTGDPLKLRLDIVDQSMLDIWLSVSGRYSYHWERRQTSKRDLDRYDNAPHEGWRHVSTVPHHFHDGDEETVTDSFIGSKPERAMREVLAFVRQKLREEAR